MEALAVLFVIIVLCIILGVKPIMLATAGAILIGLVLIFMIVVFLFFFMKLLTSHKAEAEFSRIGVKTKGRFKVAFYKVDGVEYPNVFPEEGFLEDKLYKKDRKYKVYLNKKGYVFDRFAVATCTIGFFTSILILIGLAIAAVMILK